MSIPLPKMQRNDRHLDGPAVTKLPFSSMLILELCAGTAGYTAALRRAGFDALGVDHARNRHSVQAPCAMLDLSTECGQAIAWEVLNSGRLLYVHAAPPCGTASRAREKHIPSHKLPKGMKAPLPLRSSARRQARRANRYPHTGNSTLIWG